MLTPLLSNMYEMMFYNMINFTCKCSLVMYLINVIEGQGTQQTARLLRAPCEGRVSFQHLLAARPRRGWEFFQQVEFFSTGHFGRSGPLVDLVASAVRALRWVWSSGRSARFGTLGISGTLVALVLWSIWPLRHFGHFDCSGPLVNLADSALPAVRAVRALRALRSLWSSGRSG